MNNIMKLIDFMECAIKSRDGEDYSAFIDDEGRAVFLDNNKRIRATLMVDEIIVSRYGVDGMLENNVIIPWDILSLAQKQKIIDLLEDNDDIDEEINETLGLIFS